MPNDKKTVPLEIEPEKLESTEVVFRYSAQQMEDHIKNMSETFVPLLKLYVNDVRDVRMTLAREVKDILLSSREVGKVTEMTEDILKFAAAVELLKKTLTPETVELLRRVSKE